MNGFESISDIVYLLKDNKRRTILKAIEYSDGSASFKDIQRSTHIPPTSLAYHLKIMVSRGILKKDFKNIKGRRDYSFYRMTNTGSKALDFSEIVYRRMDVIGDRQPDRFVFIPSRVGPRAFSIKYNQEDR